MVEKARLRTAWKNKNRTRSVAELANAVSAIVWRISFNAAKNLHAEDFDYEHDGQRFGVMFEYCCFLCHCADRLIWHQLDDGARKQFMTCLVHETLRHYGENYLEIFATASDGEQNLQRLNARFSSYANTGFEDQIPGFDMYRVLGAAIQEIMGDSQVNRWVMAHITDIDGPDHYQLFSKSFAKLRLASGY